GVVLVVVVADGDGQENPLSRLLVTCVRETVPNVTPRVQHVTSVTVMNHSGAGPFQLPFRTPNPAWYRPSRTTTASSSRASWPANCTTPSPAGRSGAWRTAVGSAGPG